MMRAYRAASRAAFMGALRYKANMAFLLTMYAIPPLALLFFWRGVLGPDGTLGGYDLSGLVTYYIVAQVLVAATPFMAFTEIGDSIWDGRLATWLVRPAGHYGLCLAQQAGWLALPTLVGLLSMALMAALLRGVVQIATDPRLLGAALVFWLGGALLGFTWGYVLNLLSFWFQRSSGFGSLNGQLVALLSGGVLPLDLLPAERLWLALPFRFAGWLPAQILLGRVPLSALPGQALALGAWLVVFAAVARLVWARGLIRFEGAGA